MNLLGSIDARQAEAGRAQCRRSRGGRIAVGLAGQEPGHVAYVLFELERRGVGIEIEDPEALFVAQAQQRPAVVATARRGEEVLTGDRTRRRGLVLHQVVQTRYLDRGRDLRDAGQQAQVVDTKVDHQAQPPQKRRQIPDHRSALVEVGLGSGHRNRLGPVDRHGFVGVLFLGPLVEAACPMGVGGQQQERLGLHRLRAGTDSPSKNALARVLVEQPGNHAIDIELLVEEHLHRQLALEVAQSEGGQQRTGQGVAAHRRRAHRRREDRRGMGEQRVLLHPVRREGAPVDTRRVGRLPRADLERVREDARPEVRSQEIEIGGRRDLDEGAAAGSAGQLDSSFGQPVGPVRDVRKVAQLALWPIGHQPMGDEQRKMHLLGGIGRAGQGCDEKRFSSHVTPPRKHCSSPTRQPGWRPPAGRHREDPGSATESGRRWSRPDAARS